MLAYSPVPTGGLMNTGTLDLEDFGYTENIWTMVGLSTCLGKY